VELYDYDGFDRLTSAHTGGATTSYTYNAEGLRNSKTVNGVTTDFLLNGMNVVAETTNGNTTQYLRGLQLIASSDSNNNKNYYYYNGHGDVTALTNSSGSVIKEYDYDPFGVQTNLDSNGEDSNPFRYCGEYFDKETGDIYLRARYYSASRGRFNAQDPTMDGLNLYVYCVNNPIRFIDPKGLYYVPIRDVVEAADGTVTWHAYNNITTVEVNGVKKQFSTNPIFDQDGGGKTYIDENGVMQVWIDEDTDPAFLIAINVPQTDLYEPPKGGDKWDTETKSWVDKYGNKWKKDKSNHGGPHHDVQYPNGGYDNVYEDGSVRAGKGRRGRFSPIDIYVDSSEVSLENAEEAAIITIGTVVIYEGIKWGVAAITAVPTGGASLGLAAILP